jgi:hypothetical protein
MNEYHEKRIFSIEELKKLSMETAVKYNNSVDNIKHPIIYRSLDILGLAQILEWESHSTRGKK